MATIKEREPGVWLAHVFPPPTTEHPKGRQVGKQLRGGRKAVRSQVAAWEAERIGTAPSSVGATIADLLMLWQEAKAADWQPTTVRDVRSRCSVITKDLGSVRLSDLEPLGGDRLVAKMRQGGTGEGAIRSRVGSLRSVLSWGLSRRMLRLNPGSDAKPRIRPGHRTVRPESGQVVALVAAATGESTRAGLAIRLAPTSG